MVVMVLGVMYGEESVCGYSRVGKVCECKKWRRRIQITGVYDYA